MLGEMIAEVRKDHGHTQLKLAEELNVSVQTVQSCGLVKKSAVIKTPKIFTAVCDF